MPRDGSGNYSLPASNPVASGTLIDVAWANPTMSDIALQLNGVITRDQLLATLADINANNFRLKNLNLGTAGLPAVTPQGSTTTGIWFPAVNQVACSIAGVEAWRTDTSGYLLIGASTTVGVGAARLQVGSGAATASSQILARSATTSVSLYAGGGSKSYIQYATGSALSFVSAPSDLATSTETMSLDANGLLTVSKSGTGFQKALALENGSVTAGAPSPALVFSSANYNAAIWSVRDAGPGGNLVFATQQTVAGGDPVERGRFDSSGNLLVGTNSLAFTTGGHAVLPAGGQTYALTGHITGTPSGATYAAWQYNGVIIGSITQSGTTAVVYNTTSDYRLKTNIRPADAKRFMDIKFRDFEWIDGRHDCGPIAHELQDIYPDLVIGEKDKTEIRQVEVSPAVPAVLDEDGKEITPAVPAVTEAQVFPVYQLVNYMGLIGRMGTVIQQLEKRIIALEAK